MDTNATITVPAFVDVLGAKVHKTGKPRTGTIDLRKYGPEKVHALIRRAIREINRDCLAGFTADAYRDASGKVDQAKREAERDAESLKNWEGILAGEWSPGGTGTTRDPRSQAERIVLIRLFTAQGFDAKGAAKRAKMNNPLEVFIRGALAKGRKPDNLPTDAEVAAEVEKRRPAFEKKVDAEMEVIRIERERKAERERKMAQESESAVNELDILV